jgi:hypothetical protein
MNMKDNEARTVLSNTFVKTVGPLLVPGLLTKDVNCRMFLPSVDTYESDDVTVMDSLLL